jgi:long-chain acyl-CoA synthetase
MAPAERTLVEFFNSFAHRGEEFVIYYGALLFFNGFTLPQQQAGVRETMRHIGDLVSHGCSVLIFPEGERTRTGKIGPFGVGLIASKLRIPMLPMRLIGVNRVFPRDASMVHPGPVEVRFGVPMELRGEDFDALAGRVRTQVCAL